MVIHPCGDLAIWSGHPRGLGEAPPEANLSEPG